MKRIILAAICIGLSVSLPSRAAVCHEPNEIGAGMYDPNAVAFDVLAGWTFDAGEPVTIPVDVNEPDGESVTLEVVSATVTEATVSLVSTERVGGAALHHFAVTVPVVDDWLCLNLRATDVPDPDAFWGPAGPAEPMSDTGSIMVWVRSNRPPVIIPRCGG